MTQQNDRFRQWYHVGGLEPKHKHKARVTAMPHAGSGPVCDTCGHAIACLWCDRVDGTHTEVCERTTAAEAQLDALAPLAEIDD